MDSNFGSTEQYFKTANNIATQLNEFYDKVAKDGSVRAAGLKWRSIKYLN